MFAGEICTRDVVFMTRDQAVPEAARLMRQHHVGDVVVVEEEEGRRIPVGILTDRDLVVELLAPGVSPDDVAVGDLMSRELLTLGEGQDLLYALEAMREKGVRRAPVTDIDGALVGLLTVDDIVGVIAEQLQDLSALVGRQLTRERRLRP